MRLLLVEDDAMIGRGIRQGLDDAGFTVDWVTDGGAAELALGTGVYDLAVLDLGLNEGADDYVLKPFDLDELVARVRALLRRHTGTGSLLLECGSLALDPVRREVRLHGQEVSLSAREFALLQTLMRRPGAVLSPAQLEDAVYGWQQEVGSNAVEVHLHNLRRKLGHDTIRNVRGVGYKVAEP